ncbi:MAG: ABC transporter ATP-binding protein [Eubacteriaceae bacterium]|jgi:putative ABC transport system ATP-binding protein|nr:ABC transporter ATP-binding protein [Eubacteriaceae bacterium]
MEILEVKNLCKSYGSGESEVKALDDVSFTVQKGEFVAIIGPSGSGKSTLLHMIGGMDEPTSGYVYVDGMNLFDRSEEELAVYRRRQVGFVYQFFNLIPVLNVRENIALPILMDGREPDERLIDEILKNLGMKDREFNFPSQLSGGQQQRVSIGRALINSPMMVLADEPTGNLDSKNSQEIVELLKRSNKRYNQTLIVITHDENIALQADRIMSIDDGRLTSDEVVRR